MHRRGRRVYKEIMLMPVRESEWGKGKIWERKAL